MRQVFRSSAWVGAVGAIGVLGLAACGDDATTSDATTTVATTSDASVPPSSEVATTSTSEPVPPTVTTTVAEPPAPATTSTLAAPAAVQILVTNDDGVDAAGIDALVEALRAVEGIELTVVAPATNQSGQGGAVTDGPLAVSDASTRSGYEAIAVEGTPADTIVWAIDEQGVEPTPDLVISGINAGHNLGPVIDASGTIGAARAAAQRGIPALAASQGQLEPPHDWDSGVEHVLDWLDANLDAARAGDLGTDSIGNLNVPTCTAGAIQGELDVPLAVTGDRYGDEPDCGSEPAEPPADDISAFMAGYVTYTEVSARPEPDE